MDSQEYAPCLNGQATDRCLKHTTHHVPIIKWCFILAGCGFANVGRVVLNECLIAFESMR